MEAADVLLNSSRSVYALQSATAVIEAGAGFALLIFPSNATRLLLGAPLDAARRVDRGAHWRHGLAYVGRSILACSRRLAKPRLERNDRCDGAVQSRRGICPWRIRYRVAARGRGAMACGHAAYCHDCLVHHERSIFRVSSKIQRISISSNRAMSYNQPVGDTSLIACLHCDLLQRIPDLEPGASARCPRCNKELWRHRVDSLNRTLALTVGAVLLYVIANSVPMLGLTIVGRDASTTVIGGAQHLWNNDQKIVGVLVLFTAVIAPALQIGLMLLIMLGAMRARPPSWVGTLLRYHPTTRIWSMIEVMMVGVLVALVKIADYATVIPGLALFVLWVLVFVLAGMSAAFDSRDVWERIQWADEAQHDAAGESLVEGTS